MQNALDIIERRISQRSYAEKPVDDRLKKRLRAMFSEYNRGPFGGAVRFSLLDLDEVKREEARKLGTYGVIKGARLYLLAAVESRRCCMEDLGYCMEKIILEATSLGLGTCWLAGTFRRSSFAAQMKLTENELLPAVTPVGYPAEKPTIVDRVMRYGAGSRRRKPWEELFFAVTPESPLSEAEAGEYRAVLEAVRQGPSASNKQPWRLIKENAGSFKLYLKEDRRYNRAMGDIRIQNIDMGIAMSHFELAARELGLPGQWQKDPDGIDYKGLTYIATWSS